MRNSKNHDIRLTGGSASEKGSKRFQDDFEREAFEGLSQNPGWRKDVREVKNILRKKWGIPVLPVYFKFTMYTLATAVCLVFVFIISEKWYDVREEMADKTLADETVITEQQKELDSFPVTAVPDAQKQTETILKDERNAGGDADKSKIDVTVDLLKSAEVAEESPVVTDAEALEENDADNFALFPMEKEESKKAEKKASDGDTREMQTITERTVTTTSGLVSTSSVSQELAGAAFSKNDDSGIAYTAGLSTYPTEQMYDLIVVDYSRIRTVSYFDQNLTDISSVEPQFENQDAKKNESAPAKVTDELKNDGKIAYIDFLRNAMYKFKSKSYSAAIADYEIILKHYPTDQNAIFYGGLCYYNLAMPDKAISNFDKILTGNIIVFYEESEWYKALSLIDASRKDEARILLEKISRNNGFYSKNAAKKLNELK